MLIYPFIQGREGQITINEEKNWGRILGQALQPWEKYWVGVQNIHRSHPITIPAIQRLLVAILDFTVGAPLQAVSKCPQHHQTCISKSFWAMLYIPKFNFSKGNEMTFMEFDGQNYFSLWIAKEPLNRQDWDFEPKVLQIEGI